MSWRRALSRRSFLGRAAAAAAVPGAVVAAVGLSGSRAPDAARVAAHRRHVPENSLPGDPHWWLSKRGAPDAIMGYTGQASVLPGQPVQLYVSTTSREFTVKAFRMGWYGGDLARLVWQSGPVRGHRQRAAAVDAATRTVHTDWGPSLTVPTAGWPAGSYLLRLDAHSGAQRYVPLTVRSAATKGQVVLKNGVADLAGLQHLGRLRPVPGTRRVRGPLAGGQPGPAVRPGRRLPVHGLRAEADQPGRADGAAARVPDQHGHRRRPARRWTGPAR